MKKTLLISLTTLFCISICFSQDIITTKTGDDILAKISEIGPAEIKYKKFDNLDGPMYTMLKSEILMIRYENGTNDVFKDEQTSNAGRSLNTSNLNLYEQGQQDAESFYQGYKGAGTGTLIVSLLSPLVGLIPAIACANTRPKDRNLMYPDADLMKNTNYYNGYLQKSRKVKSKKVWKNWFIALGVNFVLVIALQSQ